MTIEETRITREILQSYTAALSDCVESDVILVGGGPANLTAAFLLAREGHKVVLFERFLAPGGGMWGGGMMFSRIVVQEEARHLLDLFAVDYRTAEGGLHIVDSVQLASSLTYHAARAGAHIFNSITAEDILLDGDRISGLVINWRPVLEKSRLPVDPLTVRARAVVDGTGHDARVCQLAAGRGLKFNTPSGGLGGEGAMSAERGEEAVVKHTGEIFPGLYVAGMAATVAFGTPRMGPIFGGMLLSGEKVARLLSESLGGTP